MKPIYKFVLIVSIVLSILDISIYCFYNQKYNSQIGNSWEICKKDPTAQNIDKLVNDVERSNLNGYHNAIFFKNYENSYESYLMILKKFQENTKYSPVENKYIDISDVIDSIGNIWWKKNSLLYVSGCITILPFMIILIGIIIKTYLTKPRIQLKN